MALGLDTLPTTILYDAEGREVWRMTGMADWDGERAARLLTEADAGPARRSKRLHQAYKGESDHLHRPDLGTNEHTSEIVGIYPMWLAISLAESSAHHVR